MHSNQRFSSLGIALLASLGMAELASAQAIIITNSNNDQIPLRAGSSVQIEVDGNLLAECALNSSGQCAQLSTGTGGPENKPTATLGRSDNNTDVTTGESINLTWSSTNAVVCSAASTGPSSLWSGPRVGSGGEPITFSAVGDYSFSLTCFNINGASTVQTVPVSVAQAPVETIVGCNIQSADPAFRPAGYQAYTKDWAVAFKSPD